MIGLLLTLALLPQGSNQARLHPADAMVMVEVPDVTKLLAAYEKAPMMAMMHDAEVQKAFYGAFEDTDIDVDGMLSEALLKLGMPAAFAKDPMAGIHHYMEGIQGASFSINVDRKGLEDFAPRAARLATIGEQLAAIHAAVEAYQGAAQPSASTLPKQLAALGLDSAALTDPWKHPYEYRVEADGKYVLRSLGADGKVGGSGDDADITIKETEASAENYMSLLGFQAVIEFKNQVALDELRTALAGMFTKSGAKAVRSGPFQLSGIQAELQSWTAPEGELDGLEVWMMRAQNMLVLGGGRATPEAFGARLADPRVQTAAEQFYAGLLKNFGAPTGATIVQGTLRLSDYAPSFRKFAQEQGGDTEALDMLEGMLPNASLRMQLVGDRFVSELTTMYTQPNETITAALGLGPVPKGLLSAVPEDAIGVYLASIDGALAWKTIKQELSKDEADTEAAQEQLAEVEAKYNFSVEKDIFGSVGKGVLMYLLPLKGVTSIPGMALVVDLKDPVAMQKGIEGLMAMLGDEAGEEFKVRSKPYRDAPVWTFNFGQDESGGGMNPLMNAFSPSITIVKNRLIVTLNSTHIKKEIKRALGEETGAHLIATEGHLPPAEATSFTYMDWSALLNGVYEGGRGLVGLMGAGMVPVDVTKLPEPGVFTHFYKPTIYYSKTIPGGVYQRNESSFGPEVWLSLIGIGAVAGFATTESEELESPDSAEGDEGMESDDEGDEGMESGDEDAEADQEAPAGNARLLGTNVEMRHLATSVAVYQMDSGKYPQTLELLLKATKNYPDGFLGKGALPTDGWGHGFKYSLLDSGARYRLWSMGPDGVDQQGGGDDIVSP